MSEENTHPYHDAVAEAIKDIQELSKKLAGTLNHPDLASINIRLQNDLQRPQQYLNSLIGYSTNLSSPVPASADYGPVTTFMGQEIKRIEPITAETLTPTEADRDAFLRRRDEIYDRFVDTPDETVFSEILKEPRGEKLVRSVAKRAGLYSYEDAEMNAEFLADIRTAIQKKAETETASTVAANAAVLGEEPTSGGTTNKGGRQASKK